VRFVSTNPRHRRSTCKISPGGAPLPEHEEIVSQLHEAFSSRIYFLALRELRSHPTAEDVCHETLMRVMEAVRSGKVASPDSLPGFVAGTARNVIHEFRRTQARAGPLGERDYAAPEKPQIVDSSIRRAMETVFDRLKPRERDVLRLYYYEELSKEEISRRLGIDPERVRLVKSRALKTFREFYLRLTEIKKK
jgi:RNA polymerase sigma factor (sigma-70 family)